jgi:hypothetical protein
MTPEISLALEIANELARARTLFPDPQHSLHEGYAVMAEEGQEVWTHVCVNQKKRDYPAIRKELIQVAAMAMRTILEIVDKENRT